MADKDITFNINVNTQEANQNIEQLNQNLDNTKKKVDEIGKETQKSASSVGGFGSAFESALNGVNDTLGNLGGSVRDVTGGIKKAVPIVKSFNKTAISGLKGIKGAIAATGIGALIILLTTGLTAVTKHWDGFLQAIGVSEEKFKEFKATVIDVLKNIVSGAVGVGNVIVQSLIWPIRQTIVAAKGLGAIMKDVFTGNWSDIKKDFQEAVSGIDNAFRKGFDFSGNFAAGKEAGEKFVAGVVTTFTYKKPEVKKAGEKAGKNIVDSVQEGINKEADKIFDKLLDEKKFEKRSKEFVEKELPAFKELLSKQAEGLMDSGQLERGFELIFGDPETMKEMVEAYSKYMDDATNILLSTNHTAQEQQEAVNQLATEYTNKLIEIFNKRVKVTKEGLQKELKVQKETNKEKKDISQEEEQLKAEHNAVMEELSLKPEEERNEKLYEIEQKRLLSRKAYLEELQKLEQKGSAEYLRLENQILDVKNQIEESTTRKEKQIQETKLANFQSYMSSIQEIAGMMNSIINGIIDSEEARLDSLVKKGKIKQEDADKMLAETQEKLKGWQIAQVWINALAGSAAALSSPIMMTAGPAGWIAAGVQAAALLTEAAVTTAKIKNTTYGSTPSGNPSTDNPTYQAGPLQLTQDITPAPTMNIPVSSENTRVYILESDIQQSNNRVRVREENTTW